MIGGRMFRKMWTPLFATLTLYRPAGSTSPLLVKILILILEWTKEKIPYKPHVYELVDDRSLSYITSRKSPEKII